MDPNHGDAWAYSYKFELECGIEEQQQAILERCVRAEPHKGTKRKDQNFPYSFLGENWIAVSKDINNANWKTDQILKEVAKNLKGFTVQY